MLDRIVTTGSVTLRRFGGDRAGEMAAHRFLDNDRVSAEGIVEILSARTAQSCRGRRIVAVQDTTEINFAGRDKGRRDLGAGGNGDALGFFLHPVIAVDRDEDAVLGVIDAQIWTRGDDPLAPRRQRVFADKESYRWHVGAERTAARLAGASQRIMVADREADIYPLFARCPDGVDLVIRSAHDRTLAPGSAPPGNDRLKASVGAFPERGSLTLEVRGKPGQKARRAHLALRAGRVTLCRPSHRQDLDDAEELSLNVVESREIDAPKGVKPLTWRLLTTLPVDSPAQVREVIDIYRQRWRIEEVFRVLKNNGLKLEDTQIQAAHRLFKLAALAIIAATRIIQLVDARDRSSRPADDVMDPELIEPAAMIGKTLEGKTERQRNPHEPGGLAWLSWIVARLGGWNCYYKPPGPKTMATGWKQLASMISGVLIAQQNLADV